MNGLLSIRMNITARLTVGPKQNKNWCVTRPWWDEIMGTRVPYIGTEREARDLEKRARRAARRAQP